jgi:hypothetical protein
MDATSRGGFAHFRSDLRADAGLAQLIQVGGQPRLVVQVSLPIISGFGAKSCERALWTMRETEIQNLAVEISTQQLGGLRELRWLDAGEVTVKDPLVVADHAFAFA